MEKNDYAKAIKIPLILLIIHVILAYLLTLFRYKDVTTYEQVLASASSVALYSILLMIFSLGIFFYAGWITVSKYNGTIKNSVLIGLIIGGIQIILSIINIILMYATISGYKIGLSPMAGLGEAGIFVALFATLIGIPFALLIDVGVAALGGFVSKKVSKK